jgi:hypothetical protein
MTDDLVKRLRDEAQINANYDGIAYQLLTRTADRIEALMAENERLRSVLRYYVDKDDYGERARAALEGKQ